MVSDFAIFAQKWLIFWKRFRICRYQTCGLLDSVITLWTFGCRFQTVDSHLWTVGVDSGLLTKDCCRQTLDCGLLNVDGGLWTLYSDLSAVDSLLRLARARS